MNDCTDPVIASAIAHTSSQRELSRLSGLSQQYISKLLYRSRRASAETAIAIEKATGGKVDRSEIRPDLWAITKAQDKRAASDAA